jgi:hypothetical protein
VVVSDPARSVVATIDDPVPLVAVGVFEPEPCPSFGIVPLGGAGGAGAGGRRLEFEFTDVHAGTGGSAADEATTRRYRSALEALDDAQARGVPVREQLPLIREVAAAEDELGLDLRSPAARAAADRLVDRDDDRYREALETAVVDEPRDVEAWVALGSLVLEPGPDHEARDAGDVDLAAAYTYFETAVGVAELSLPASFAGTTPYARIANRPWLHALHGMLTCRVQAGGPDAAADVEDTLLWLDPADPLRLRASALTPF